MLPTFPQSIRYSILTTTRPTPRLSRAGEEKHTLAHEPGLIAIRLVKNVRELADAINQLGQAKHTAAVPLLAELWPT